MVDWSGYPEGGEKLEGPFRVLEGQEQTTARNAANRANGQIHRADPSLAGKEIHEIHSVKFGRDPTSLANKVPLSPSEHRAFTTFWARLLRSLKE